MDSYRISELLKDKVVGLVGLGKSNLSLANYLLNYTTKIFVTEILPEDKVKQQISLLDKRIKYECGGHSDKILLSDIVIKSPGIPQHHPLIQKISSKKIPILTELEVSYRIIVDKLSCRPQIIAVTGTNGKTTTTTLIGEIFLSYKKNNNVIVAGNIGTPLIDFVDKIKNDTIIVLEVSSYQLENIEQFSPRVACLLNIAEDHLDHHITMQDYINAKTKIFINQQESDFAILNYDDQYIRNINLNKFCAQQIYFSTTTKLKKGCYWDKENRKIVFSNDEFGEIVLQPQIKLPGIHNIENILTAVCCSILLNVPKEIVEQTISNFTGVEHRLEFVREIDGIKFINDSKSTNVNSTLVALKSFNEPICLILGGRDKGAPYTPLIPLITQKVKLLLLIGEATDIIYSQLKNCGVEIVKCGDMFTAVTTALRKAKRGDIVLLSPACSSFDQYRNFEHRGTEFKKIVNNL